MQQQVVTVGDSVEAPEQPPDFPPESVCLSKDAELEWFDRNAFYERKESTKLTSNAFGRNPSNSNPVTSYYSGSPRTNRNRGSKTRASSSMIGFLDFKSRFAKAAGIKDKKKKKEDCPNGKMRLFAGQTGSDPDVIEPRSPEVSCTGRVGRAKGESGRSGSGVFAVFQGMVRLGCTSRSRLETNGPFEETKVSSSSGSESVSRKSSGKGEPPELDGLKRFSSCRRPDVHG